MSRKGNCWCNEPSERFFNSLKNERVHGSRYATRDAARADVFKYIEVFYNRVRRRSSLDGVGQLSCYETWLNRQLASKQAAKGCPFVPETPME
jgi:putative transposase